MNLARLVLGNLLRRPVRTVITVAAISLGVAAVVALTSIAWGFEMSWQQANDARGTDLIVTRVASENAMPSSFPASTLQATLQALPHVQEVVGLLSEMLSIGDSSTPVFVFGWAYDSYLWTHLRLLEGAADRGDGIDLGMSHRGDPRFDFLNPCLFERERNRDLAFKREHHPRRLLTISQRAVVDDDGWGRRAREKGLGAIQRGGKAGRSTGRHGCGAP